MRSSALALAVGLAVLGLAAPASAEWFADAYIGGAVTSADDITFTTFGVERTQDANFGSSAVYGLRGGRWFDQLPWAAAALDFSYFKAGTDVHVFPISVLLMARYGFLKDEEFRQGRLQAYGGLGPGIFISHLGGSIGFSEGSDTSTDIGLDTRVGVSYGIDASWAGFLEYRFTHFSPTYDIKAFTGTVPASTDVNTNHFVLGISYRF